MKPDVRKGIHVGNHSFYYRCGSRCTFFEGEAEIPVTSELAELLQYCRVLIYRGQMDTGYPYSAMESCLRDIEWPGAKEYKRAARKHWRVGDELAGYWKTAGNLNEVLVRNSGHLAPSEQPLWTWDMITRFTYGKVLSNL